MRIQTTRRHFVRTTPFAGLALLAACSPKAEPPVAPVATAPAATAAASTDTASAPATTAMELPMVQKSDAQAMALGYVDDAIQADTVKFKNYVAGSDCANCILYQGKVGDAAGACPLFAGKNVAAKGWCSSWARKA